MIIILSLDKVSRVPIYFRFPGMPLILNILLVVKSCVRQHILIFVLKFFIVISKYILNFLEKDYEFSVNLRVIIKERLKRYDNFLC